MSQANRSQKGNAIIWVLVAVVILIGVYFIVKNTNQNAVTPYNADMTNTYPSDTSNGASTDAQLDADFNSASNDLNSIDTNNIDQGL
jgi:cell division protein FtsN